MKNQNLHENAKKASKAGKTCKKIIDSLETTNVKSTPPKRLILDTIKDPGFFFGTPLDRGKREYIGKPQECEGNILVCGGSGSGKSHCIGKPTLQTWKGPICATDIKGELSSRYAQLHFENKVTRPYTVFDPMQPETPAYDPFWLLLNDTEDNLIGNIWDIVNAIIPLQPNDSQPFWVESEQGILAAALLYYFQHGLSFSETVCLITGSSLTELCESMAQSSDIRVKMYLGEVANMKAETIACLDRELRKKLALFATDKHLSHAFRGEREGTKCFDWGDLEEYNIFLRVPEDKLNQWGRAINLMITQLIRYLERRPEKHGSLEAPPIPTLLLLDEFAHFGKLEPISNAIATLRSKNVTICLMVQSIAQLDKIYGEYDRRIIFDNCQYKAILNSGDAETQKYIADLAGTCIQNQYSVSVSMDDSMDVTGCNIQISKTREPVVCSHELSEIKKILLLTPYGFCWVNKFYMNSIESIHSGMFDPGNNSQFVYTHKNGFKINEGAEMMSIEDRTRNASARVDNAEQRQRVANKQALEEARKKVQRQTFLIGKAASKHLPEVTSMTPEELDEFFSELAKLR